MFLENENVRFISISPISLKYLFIGAFCLFFIIDFNSDFPACLVLFNITFSKFIDKMRLFVFNKTT